MRDIEREREGDRTREGERKREVKRGGWCSVRDRTEPFIHSCSHDRGNCESLLSIFPGVFDSKVKGQSRRLSLLIGCNLHNTVGDEWNYQQ